MSKRINNSKIVACMLALGFMAVGSGCTDSDFDLSSIDSTIGLGGDGLQLPACSTEDMLLDDVLDLNNSDFISIADNGDYIFTKDGGDMTPAHPNIDKVEVTKARVNNNFKVEIPVSSLTQVKRKSARREKLHTPASVEGKAIEFHYTGTAPYEIRELTSAKCSADVTIRVNVTNELKKVVPTFKTMTIQLPSYMKLNVAKCSPMQPEYDAEKGIVTFRNVSSSANIALNATVNRLDLKTKATKENHLTFTPGKNDADGFIDLNGEVLMGVTFDEVNLGNNSTNNLYLSASMSLGTIVITEATGKFDPEIKLEDLGSVDINDVPDFLTDKDVTIDLYNPVIDLVVTSDIDVAGVVYSTLTAEDEHGNNIAKVVIPKMTTKPNTKTHICICKRQDGVDKSKYDEVLEVPNLSDIVKRIPKRIRYVAEAHADATREGTLVLGKEYTIYAAMPYLTLLFGSSCEHLRKIHTDLVPVAHSSSDTAYTVVVTISHVIHDRSLQSKLVRYSVRFLFRQIVLNQWKFVFIVCQCPFQPGSTVLFGGIHSPHVDMVIWMFPFPFHPYSLFQLFGTRCTKWSVDASRLLNHIVHIQVFIRL